MNIEIENKLCDLLDLLNDNPNKYDIAPEICFEIMCFCSDTHKGAHAILEAAKDLYFEHVIDCCEDEVNQKEKMCKYFKKNWGVDLKKNASKKHEIDSDNLLLKALNEDVQEDNIKGE